jgi:hypothetical protein
MCDTPKDILENFLKGAENYSDAIIIIRNRKTGEFDVGWSTIPLHEQLGMLELAKKYMCDIYDES